MDTMESTGFANVLQRGWWRLLLRGLAAIAFGLIAWLRPGISLAALVIVFGLYALVDGILCVWMGIAGRKLNEDWWVLLLMGFIGIGVGLLTFSRPGITALGLLFYIAIWAIARGALEIVAAIHLRKEVKGEWRLVVAALASIALGVFLMASPARGVLALLWVIGLFAIVFGVMEVILAFRARKFVRTFAPM
jgi:uncharacterized membrane protein HdeD (DUF308 family)